MVQNELIAAPCTTDAEANNKTYVAGVKVVNMSAGQNELIAAEGPSSHQKQNQNQNPSQY